MKKFISIILVAFLGSASTAPLSWATDNLTCAEGGVCNVGDVGPGGGTVFYVSQALEAWGKYIEVAPAGWFRGRPDPNIEPFCYEKTEVLDLLPRTSPAIGSGQSNTDALIIACPNGAAAAARSYRGGGFENWSLPSKDEFTELFYEVAGLGLFPNTPWYWSSTTTEYGQVSSFYVPFERWDGTFAKSNDAYVRPVRHFAPLPVDPVPWLAGHGPSDGEFSAWTKVLAGGSQMKFYAKYLQPGQKVQFMVQDSDGVYKQFAWKRITNADLGPEGQYTNLQNHVYFIRTFDLKPGKNRVRIYVDGQLVWGTKTYSR